MYITFADKKMPDSQDSYSPNKFRRDAILAVILFTNEIQAYIKVVYLF